MTEINLVAKVVARGGVVPLRRGSVTATAFMDTGEPYLEVVDDTITFEQAVRVEIIQGIPVEPIDLKPTGSDWHWLFELENQATGQVLSVKRRVPGSGPVDFADLVAVV